MRVSLKRIYAWRPKVIQTLEEIRRGRLSYSSDLPVVVSRLDVPRGGLFIVDGHHRVVEAVLRRARGVDAVVDRYVPWIERTGGAHRGWLEDMVNVSSFVKTRRVVPGGRVGRG